MKKLWSVIGDQWSILCRGPGVAQHTGEMLNGVKAKGLRWTGGDEVME